jgi:biopolymer transport protein ExbB
MDETRSSARHEHAQSERRRWTIGAWIGAILCAGPLVGLAGTMLGMMHTFRVIESERAPTPDQLRIGVDISSIASIAGIVISVAGVALLVLSLLRLSRLARLEHTREPDALPSA